MLGTRLLEREAKSPAICNGFDMLHCYRSMDDVHLQYWITLDTKSRYLLNATYPHMLTSFQRRSGAQLNLYQLVAVVVLQGFPTLSYRQLASLAAL